MAIKPETNLFLLKCPLEMDNRNQLTFSNENTQFNYFYSLEKLEVDNITYQRKDNIIRYPAHIDSIINYNYCMYQNTNYTNKWFYAFITDMKYINDSMTEITIKTDVWQTWNFSINLRQSFIERQHVKDDTIGIHTIPENVETGEYISTRLQPSFKGNLSTCFCVSASDTIFDSYTTTNEILPSGLYYFGLTSLEGIRQLIKKYEEATKGSAINGVFVIPRLFFSNWRTETGISGQISTSVRFNTSSEEIKISKINYLDDNYVPKNNKLLCYPYSFLQVSNHNGMLCNYRWEEFNKITNDSDCTFILRGALSVGGSFSAYPSDYKGILTNYDEAITLGKYPVGGWNSDTYTNWLTEQGVNRGIQGASAFGDLVIGGSKAYITGGATGSDELIGGLSKISNLIAQDYQHSLMPNQAMGNTNVGDYSFTYGLTNLEFKRMSIKREYAKMIDDYFTMFGYKVNSLDYPNINGRSNFNYVKTVGLNLDAKDIPERDLEEIKQMFDTGITLWHNPSTFLNYSVNNDII